MTSYADSSPASDAGDAVDERHVADSDILMIQDDEHLHEDDQVDGLRSDDEESGEEQDEPRKMSARAYQLEMLEKSMKRNIIVTMDTGSGKTQVAVLRIAAELERTPNNMRVWFLAPTVALSEQQHEVLRAQIPGVQTRLLIGKDNIDAWSEQRVWDTVLMNVRIVVSTPQILLDALKHGFVVLQSLSLLVIDEAHNCKGKNAGSRIMKDFYKAAKSSNLHVPHILGLTASPVLGSRLDSLEELEDTLDAICMSPKVHREELLAQVNRPEMFNISYGPGFEPNPRYGFTDNMLRLHQAYEQLDIETDPQILALQADGSDRSLRKLQDLLKSGKTVVRKGMNDLLQRSISICRDLGPWAADYYICEAVRRYTESIDDLAMRMDGQVNELNTHLSKVMKDLRVSKPDPKPNGTPVTGKVRTLINILLSHEDGVVGIVFVKERCTVAVLTHLLSIHPAVSKKYRVGSMVGTSKIPGKRDSFLDLSRTEDMASLLHFRSGKVNLLIATSVLEEGIDVPACNLVVNVDKPANLKSFIQRRGRARMKTSRLYLLVDEQSHQDTQEWEWLEAKMKSQYESDMRQLQALEQLEESEIPDFPPLFVPSTGAQLTIDDAKPHLEHFCMTLSSRKYVDWRPDYIFQEVEQPKGSLWQEPLIRATVILPMSLPGPLQRIQSSRAWRTERIACKDAAFQAYTALYRAGLVNDNLMPMGESDFSGGVEGRPGITDVREQANPWLKVAWSWLDQERDLYQQQIRLLDEAGLVMCKFNLMLPLGIPDMPNIPLYWHSGSRTPLLVEFVGSAQRVRREASDLDGGDDSATLLAMSYGHRWPAANGQSLVRLRCHGVTLTLDQIGQTGYEAIPKDAGPLPCLVRDSSNCPYFYHSWLPSKPAPELVHRRYYGFENSPENVPYLVVDKWPKKMGFFRQPQLEQGSPHPRTYPRVLPAHESRLDSVPISYVKLGGLVPSILHYLETCLVAQELLTDTKLASLNITNFSLVLTAISAPSARNPADYERVEFLGDSILKFCTTINCAAQYLHFPEGYLSLMKDRLVSNSRLCKAAIKFGLDRFILTKQFTSYKWRPASVEDMLSADTNAEDNKTRRLSTKVAADVVEALIGASYLSGGMNTALSCIALFLPEVKWQDIHVQREVLFRNAPDGVALPATLEPVEQLIGYTFRKKSLLLEAMTHSSYRAAGLMPMGAWNSSTGAPCLERLEFLGDAILDNVVVTKLVAVDPPLPHDEMHLLRTALVNGDILGFLVLEWHVNTTRFDATVEEAWGRKSGAGGDVNVTGSDVPVPLWKFMRHSSAELAVEQRETMQRHERQREGVLAAVREGGTYPWAQLARMRMQKVFSDILESLIGAVWVDSSSEAACEAVVERAGVLPYMRRLLADKVHILHPKEELGRLADRERVEYVIDSTRLEEGDRAFSCKVMVGDRCWAEVSDGVSREEVKTKAADEAVRAIKEERMRVAPQ